MNDRKSALFIFDRFSAIWQLSTSVYIEVHEILDKNMVIKKKNSQIPRREPERIV